MMSPVFQAVRILDAVPAVDSLVFYLLRNIICFLEQPLAELAVHLCSDGGDTSTLPRRLMLSQQAMNLSV